MRKKFLHVVLTALLAGVGALSLSGCQWVRSWWKNEPPRLAQIDDYVLYRREVEQLVPQGLSPQDSLHMVNHYIDLWAMDLLLLKRAEAALSKEEKDVSKELENYRKSLLVFRYQKSYVEEHIDTLVMPEEITTYYAENSRQFALTEPVVKARLLKLGLRSPYLPLARQIYKDPSEEDRAQLDEMGKTAAALYTNYNERWIEITRLAQDLPLSRQELLSRLKPKGYMDVSDSLYAYLVHIQDYIPAGTPAPLEMKENSIKQIIISKRKQTLLQELEANVLQEGHELQQIKIYN